MINRKPDVLLGIANNRLAILETASGVCRVMPRDGQLDVVASVSAALADFHSRKSWTAVVLATDFFTQMVRLGTAQTRGLSQPDLASVLAFEVEPFSSIPRDQGRLAYVPGGTTGDFSTWNIVQISNAELSGIISAARKRGVKVIGAGSADHDFAEGDEAQTREWLLRRAEEIGAGTSSFPVVSALPSRDLGSGAVWSGVVTAGLVVACLVHFGVLSLIRSSRESDAAKLDVIAASVEQVNNNVRECEKRIQAIDEENARRLVVIRRLGLYQASWLSLFRQLPVACGEQVIVRSINSAGPFDVRINAFSTVEDGPYRCMEKLSGLMRESGWTVLPERTATVQAMGEHGPVQFVFGIRFDENLAEKKNDGKGAP